MITSRHSLKSVRRSPIEALAKPASNSATMARERTLVHLPLCDVMARDHGFAASAGVETMSIRRRPDDVIQKDASGTMNQESFTGNSKNGVQSCSRDGKKQT